MDDIESEIQWHAIPATEALEKLGADADGLTTDEAAERLRTYGPNQLIEREGTSAWTILADQFRNPLIILLLIAAAVLFVVSFTGEEHSELFDASLITAIVLFNAGLGFTQNYRADRGIESLRRLSAPTCTVLRDGFPHQMPSAGLVPGDVVLLEEGDRIPADGRVLSSATMMVDESALTGESVSVQKSPEPTGASTVLAERSSMTYTGTIVVSGRGRFTVTSTAMQTEVGKITEQVQEAEEEPTRFQREVGKLGLRIGYVVGFLVLLTAGVQLITSELSVLETVISAVALAVAAIPEGLPVVLTLALAFGTREMLSQNALVRSLPVVEIIGAANVICTDKTGTVTEGRMTARVVATMDHQTLVGPDDSIGEEIAQEDGAQLRAAVLIAGLCNNARPHPELGFVGDPTETALMSMTHHTGVDLTPYERIEEIPFSSERRMMSVAVRGPNGVELLTKGGVEAVLPLCATIHEAGELVPISRDHTDQIIELNRELADRALRVLALARRTDPPHPIEDSEAQLEFVALVGISDPPREEAAAAMRVAHDAGMRIVMITGDNAVTARAIAHEVGLDGEAVAAAGLDDATPEGVAEIVTANSVFARAEPRHKVAILNELKRRGSIVVMTGDGVNDAPALKNADVGIAMGIRGTDVARDASEMVLLDDNFATIVAAVAEGRRIARNIKKFVTYLLAGNLAEVAVIFIGSLFGYLPVSAVQILWVNLVTDSGPAIALGVDPHVPGEMEQPPRTGPIMSRSMVMLIASLGAVVAGVILVVYFYALNRWDEETARTLAFTSLVLLEYAKLVVLRLREGTSLFANRWLIGAVAASLTAQVAIVYTPLSDAFGVVALGASQLLVLAIAVAVGFTAATLLTKVVVRRYGPL